MSLKEASDRVTVLRSQIAEGIDPAGERKDHEGTFGEMCGVYLRERGKGRERLADSTLTERRRIFASPELDPLRKMPPLEITSQDVARVLDPFEKRDSLTMLNRVQQSISSVFDWAVARRRYGLLENPVKTLPRRTRERPRDRYLTPDEIKTVWHDLAEGSRGGPQYDASPTLRSVLRLILLTGQRPGEVCAMRWSDIDGSTWTMPKGYRKKVGGRPTPEHRVHLSALALEQLPEPSGEFVFPATGSNGSQRGSGSVNVRSVSQAVRRIVGRLDMESWTPHDLRRTARTLWSEFGITDFVLGEKMVGHQLPKILQTYDRSEQWEDRVKAFDAWGALVAEWVADEDH